MQNGIPEYDLGDMSDKDKLRNQIRAVLYITYQQGLNILWESEFFMTGGASVETGEHLSVRESVKKNLVLNWRWKLVTSNFTTNSEFMIS